MWSDNYVSPFPGGARTLGAFVPGGAPPPDVRVEVRGMNVPASIVPAVRDAGRQAVGGTSSGVPELVLDGSEGPAANLGRDHSERVVSTVVDVALDVD